MITVDLRGHERLLEKSWQFQNALVRTISKSLGRSLRKTAGRIRSDLRGVDVARGITRSRWGKDKRHTLGARVKTFTVKLGEKDVEAAIGLYGYPAVLEAGGRLVPHEIVISQRGRTTSIKHPGGSVPGHGFGGSNLRRDEGAILAQLDADVGELLKRVYEF